MSRRNEPVDARYMALGMDGAWDVYRKLLWEVRNYREAATSKVPVGGGAAEEIRWPMYWAINAASTAWSLIEWVWFEVEQSPDKRAVFVAKAGAEPEADCRAVKAALRGSVPTINACNQMAHATKHARLGDRTEGFSTNLRYDVWCRAGYLFWSVDANVKNPAREEDQTIDQVLDDAVSWWKHTLEELAIPDRLHTFPAPPGSD